VGGVPPPDLGHAHDVRDLPVHVAAAVAYGFLLARRRIERLHHLQPCRQPVTPVPATDR
jgi:hypothetical protein